MLCNRFIGDGTLQSFFMILICDILEFRFVRLREMYVFCLYILGSSLKVLDKNKSFCHALTNR
jgi:hypothetical protein